MAWHRRLGVALLALVFASASAADGFVHSLRLQPMYEHSELSAGPANPDNRLAQLPSRRASLELRPELAYRDDWLELRARPRLRAQMSAQSQPDGATRERTATAYLNEWRAGLNPGRDWQLWAGREVMAWGPAQSLSPSNPFFTDSGRTHPYRELGGRDFIGLTWWGPAGVTASVLDNVRLGRDELAPLESFQPLRVVKLDRAGRHSYWSVNAAWPGRGDQDAAPDRVGGYLQANLGEALLLYTELGLYRQRTQQLPAYDRQLGWHFAAPAADGPAGLGLVGAAYTLAAGPTLTLEYLHNSQGWDAAQAADFGALLADAGARLGAGGQEAGLAALTLAQAVQPGSVLLRRHYLFAQYRQPDVLPRLDLILQAHHNLDDRGTRWASTVEWRSASRWRLFGMGLVNTGAADSEARLYLERQWLVGGNLRI